jgi:hypothetical protein
MKTGIRSVKRWWLVIALLLCVALLQFLLSRNAHSSFDSRSRDYMKAVQIQTAVDSYRIEYGVSPDVSSNSRLMKILCGDNPRHVEFIALKASDISENGEVIDSRGTPFRITINRDGKALVISAGPDKLFGTTDDIVVE